MNQKKRKVNIDIRPIAENDNAVIAEVIRLVMTEFEAFGCGYSINDSEVDDMYTAIDVRGLARDASIALSETCAGLIALYLVNTSAGNRSSIKITGFKNPLHHRQGAR